MGRTGLALCKSDVKFVNSTALFFSRLSFACTEKQHPNQSLDGKVRRAATACCRGLAERDPNDSQK